MTNRIKGLALVLIIALAPLVVLLNSYLQRLEKLSGDFTRTFPYTFTDVKAFDLKYNSYYIAGVMGNDLYLANRSVTPRLLRINSGLKDTQTAFINFQKHQLEWLSAYELIIDSPNFYIGYGMQHTVFTGTCDNWTASLHPVRCPYFSEYIPVNDQCVIFKYVSFKKDENSFRKVCTFGDSIEKDQILEKHVDGKFCTSGKLEFNKQLRVLTYIYAYRNQILVMDTNLNLIKKIKTIDDVDSARFEVSHINSDSKGVITKPTIKVNPQCATYKQYLFVHSKIMGRHEDDKSFEHSTVIDIYDITKGMYVYSISLPNSEKINISQLRIIGGWIYTMSNRYLTRYKVKLPE